MIVRILEGDALGEALDNLTEQLSVTAGIVSPASMRLTEEVFGEALSPADVARRIIADVRARGDQAVSEYTEKLQGVALSPEEFRVPPEELSRARGRVSEALMTAVRRSIASVRAYQEHFLSAPPKPYRPRDGVTLGMRFRPLKRVGLCIPGGKAPYPSSVIMIAVPAQVAGVRDICMVTPCGPDGTVSDGVLATAWELGIKEVYRIGGAHAVAALALGTRSVPRVDKIAGPGNIYVALAKKEVYGYVDIDMIAGPSEILIVADHTADPAHCAADMLSQAEHDPAASVLLTPARELAEAAAKEIERQAESLSRADAARECIRRFGVIGVTRSVEEAIGLANRFAPEHLEVMTAHPEGLLPKFENFGCAFLGSYATEPVGDYVAGPSHVLPTGGTARFFSALSAHDFVKSSSVVQYTRDALAEASRDICELAEAEGFDAHANAARLRLKDQEA